MTEKEAIEYMENEVRCIKQASHCNRDCLKCGLVKEEQPLLESFATAIQALKEIQQYRAIGTVDELRTAVERMKPYKPKEYEDRYYACKCDNILLPKWKKYPTELMPKSEGLPHCMACGQKLDWN